MLTPEQLKPHLLSPDHFVRSHVAERFGQSWSPDPQLLPLVLEACRKYGLGENGSCFYWATRFVATEESFRDLLGYLDEQKDSSEVGSLVRIIEAAPPPLLERFSAEIRANPAVSPESIAQIDRRLELAGWSAQQLWRELQDFSRRSDAEAHDSNIDRREGHRLVEALGRHTFPDKGMIVALLSAPEIANLWLEGWLIVLAGERRIPEAVPRLVEMLFSDPDLADWAMEPLAKIGDVRTVGLIRERFHAGDEYARNSASDLLGHLPFPETEEAIIALLETEKSRVVRTFLCISLCQIFSERAVEVIPRMMKKGYDRTISHLGEELLPILDILGQTHPDAADWRLKREEEWRRIAASLEEMRREFEERKTGVLTELAEPFIPPRLPPPLPLAPPPILTKGAKVGRNDPCPCGSGKKFKKCCGKGD